jgi:hypothetical protein
MLLYQRIQGKQRERSQSQEQDLGSTTPGNQDNWYSDDEEQEQAGKSKSPKLEPVDKPPPLGAPFALSSLNLPPELTNLVTAISAKSSQGSPGSPGGRTDPRKARTDPRRQDRRDREAEEREKDQRLMEVDLDSVFGDLELPPLAPTSPPPPEPEETITSALGLPFKAHVVQVVTETNAGVAGWKRDWMLTSWPERKSEISLQKYKFSPAQLEADPRLRKFAKTGMAKLKELPLPSFPAPKADPRLAKTKAQPPALDRRRSSEDSEGGRVYNPARELTKARQQTTGPPTGGEAYSPGQERGRYSPRDGEAAYSPGRDLPSYPPRGPWQEQRAGPGGRGGPPGLQHGDQRYPPQYDQYGPPRDHHQGRGPPPDRPDYYEGPDGRDFGGPGGPAWRNGPGYGGPGGPGGRGHSPNGEDYRGPGGDMRGAPGGGGPRRKDPRRRD